MSACKPSLLLRSKWHNESQVLGAEVPSFKNYPYRASDVLYLYKSFLKLIYHYHRPEERPDLLFRLRNEFASKRHLSGPKVISAAIRKGEGFLALQRQILDAKEVRQRSMTDRQKGAQSVDGLWDQLRTVSGNVLPGMANYENSRTISGRGYTQQSSSQNVYSRRVK